MKTEEEKKKKNKYETFVGIFTKLNTQKKFLSPTLSSCFMSQKKQKLLIKIKIKRKREGESER